NALHWMAISVYNGFFSLHTKALGLASDVPGDAMGIAILGEAAAFWFAPRLFQRYGSAPWVVAAILISALRWWLTAHTEDGATIVWLQLLHFFSFGVWYAAAIDRLGVFAGPEHRATYQGVFSAGVLSLGAIVGFLGGGWLLDVAGGAVLFRVAAGCDLLAAGVALAAWRVWARPG
ncbi:MAG: MFS transporter, partial [Myxococcota bacterium]